MPTSHRSTSSRARGVLERAASLERGPDRRAGAVRRRDRRRRDPGARRSCVARGVRGDPIAGSAPVAGRDRDGDRGAGHVRGRVRSGCSRSAGRHNGDRGDGAGAAREHRGRAAGAFDRARHHEHQQQIASTLQRSLLPARITPPPWFVVETRYWPGESGTDVGGDFFDVFQVADDRWALIIGDVCGMGIEAAALTAVARHTARAVAELRDDTWRGARRHPSRRSSATTAATTARCASGSSPPTGVRRRAPPRARGTSGAAATGRRWEDHPDRAARLAARTRPADHPRHGGPAR